MSRQSELSHFGQAIRWVTPSEAETVIKRADRCLSKKRYGLEPALITAIEHHDAENESDVTKAWLTNRVGNSNEELILVFYSPIAVCSVSARFFVESWQDIFCPSRDDAAILPAAGDWVLFYCHEDEFEFGRIIPL